MTAAEYLAEKAKELEWVEDVQRGHAADERAMLAEQVATRTLLDDLSEVGWDVSSVWDLVNIADPYPTALPVLVRHLKSGGYANRVMEGIGRALAVRPAVKYWRDIRRSYLHPRSAGERTGAAVALAACATREQFDDLGRLVCSDFPHPDAIFFLHALVRIDRERGWKIVERVSQHPVFRVQAEVMLTARERRRQRQMVRDSPRTHGVQPGERIDGSRDTERER